MSQLSIPAYFTATVSRLLALGATVLAVVGPSDAQPCEVTPSAYWKNTTTFPYDPFHVVSMSADIPDWVKFTIMACDPETVYYQDCHAYPFHYDFVAAELDPYAGISREQFDSLALHADGQELFVGTILIPPTLWTLYTPAEFGIQLIRTDPYPPEQVVALFNLVRSTVQADQELQAFYMPTYEQWESAQEHQAYFAEHGILVDTPARWAGANPVYSEGWALGTLKFYEGDDIEDAYLSGALGPDDIVLTDGVPAEMPYLAGILSLMPSTPSSHVAILAGTYGVPFAHLAMSADAERAQELVGRRIALRAYRRGVDVVPFRIVDVEDTLDEATIAEIFTLKDLPLLAITPIAPYGAYSASAEGLVLNDICHFGGKAANYGFLRRILPDDSPMACALSFDVWSEFLGQTLGGGGTLREWIDTKLAPHAWPPDMAALADDLDDIRDRIRDDDETSFPPAAAAAILTTLQDPQYGFQPDAKIRFRSSTNVEDSEQFTGAGLYDSYSGCLMDELDDDEEGPSHCDPTKNNERGVFRAIRRVFASFYNDNAYLERLRHGVNADDVGMAVLVHHSFPDEFELANGVGTLRMGGSTTRVMLVTQVGAVSVTNPEGGAVPEEVEVTLRTGYQPSTTIKRYSSLVVLGETVLGFDTDYVALAEMMNAVAQEYSAVTGDSGLWLDFEYKNLSPGGAAKPAGGLVIKQVRELPRPDTTSTVTPFLLNEPVCYEIVQSEYGDVFANHRLKSTWWLQTHNMWLSEEDLQFSVYSDVTMEYIDGCWPRTYAGQLSEFPNAWHVFDAPFYETVDGWSFSFLDNPRQYELRTSRIGRLISPSAPPLLTIQDFGYGSLEVHVTYDEPVPTVTYEGPGWTTQESIRLGMAKRPSGNEVLVERTIEDPNSPIVVRTRYYWPGSGSLPWMTWPLSHWDETTIEGLTSEPIVLRGWYSQTYRPEHHNFTEHFIFEPQLEPGLAPAVLAELNALNVQFIYAIRDPGPHKPPITLYDSAGCEVVPCAAGDHCDYPEFLRYCATPVGDCDGVGTCQIRPRNCPDGWDPVCGCDGNTYADACRAAQAGVSVDWYGPCLLGDLTGDGVVDIQDGVQLSSCWEGPDAAPTTECYPAMLDDDWDVDMGDFFVLQQQLNGPPSP